MKPHRNSGLRRLYLATVNSLAGFSKAFKEEAAIRQECGLIIVTTPLAIYLGQTGFERALLLITPLFILLTELLNSAIEATLDRLSTEFHPLIGYAKDAGSAAVLLAIIITATTWGLILFG